MDINQRVERHSELRSAILAGNQRRDTCEDVDERRDKKPTDTVLMAKEVFLCA